MVMMAMSFLTSVHGSGVAAELSFYESLDGTALTVLGVGSGMSPLRRYEVWVHGGDAVDAGAEAHLGAEGASDRLGAWEGRFGLRLGTRRTLRTERPTRAPVGRHLYGIDTASILSLGIAGQSCLVASGVVVRIP